MSEETREDGLTFGEICQRVLHRIWYVLGAAVAVTLIAVLVVYFAVNPAQQSYSMQFVLLFPAGAGDSYPDGEPFYYQELVTEKYLADVVKTEGLENINIARMIRNDDIGIVAETESVNGATRYTGRYTVQVRRTYFSGEEHAEKFIRTIAGTVETRMREAADKVSYAVSVDTFNDAPFEERITLLAQERETILEKYGEWIDAYDASYHPIADSSASLNDFRARVAAIYGESVQKELANELRSGGYYYLADAENKTEKFNAYKETLKSEYERNKKEIEALKEANGAAAVSLASTVQVYSAEREEGGDIIIESPAPNVSQRLAELIERNANILHWLGSSYLGESGEPTEGTLTIEKNDGFAARLEEERVKLENAAADLKTVTKAIYASGMAARFDVQKAEREGGVSVILVAVVAFVASFLIAGAVVCYIDGRRKKKGAASAEEPAPETPSAPETPDRPDGE